MLSIVTSSLRRLRWFQQFNLGHEPPFPPEVARELEDLRKFSLNSLMTFLGIHLIAGSKALASLTLAFLIYTINLHLSVSAGFLQNCPKLSRLLHAIPFLGICCMAIFEFVMGVHSPALAAGGLLVGTLPLLITAIHRAKSYGEMYLPVRLHRVLPLVPEPTEMTAVWSQENPRTPRRRFDAERDRRETADDFHE